METAEAILIPLISLIMFATLSAGQQELAGQSRTQSLYHI